MIRILPSGRGAGRVIRSTSEREGGKYISHDVPFPRDRVRLTNGLCILKCLALCRCSTILPVIGELVCEPGCCDRVCVNDGGTTTCDHCPDAGFSVEHSEFERGTRGGIELLDVCWCKARGDKLRLVEEWDTQNLPSSFVRSLPNGAGQTIGGPRSAPTLLPLAPVVLTDSLAPS
jgi:hypothetical protein